MGLGGRSMCLPGRKVVPSNTEGRFRLDKPAPATVRCPRAQGWGPARKAGVQVSQERPGRGPGAPQARPVGAAVGWGRWGRCAPASPGTAAWVRQLLVGVCRCPYCVRLCMIRSSAPRPPPLAPQVTRRLCTRTGERAVLWFAPWRGQKLSVFAHSGGTCALALCSGRREECAGEGGGTSRGACWVPGAGERRPPLVGLRNLFSVCLSLFFPFALSVSSLLIRSPNPPAFTVEKPDTQVSGAPGLHTEVQYCAHTQLTWWGDGGRRGRKEKKSNTSLNLPRAGLDPHLHGAGSKRVGVAVFKKYEIIFFLGKSPR